MYHTSMNQKTLPQEEITYLSSLSPSLRLARLRALWVAGWSLSEIGNSFKPSIHKATLHYQLSHSSIYLDASHPIPDPPRSPATPLPSEIAPELRRLSSLAQRYRSKMDQNSPQSKANIQLTLLAKQLRSQGVPTAEIANAAGVTYRAMAKRLAK